MKHLALIITFLACFNPAAQADDALEILPVVYDLLLFNDDTSALEYLREQNCAVPVNPPRPGFEVKGQCGRFGLKAAGLNTRAAAFAFDTPAQDFVQACALVAQYKSCGFTTDINMPMCNELQRSVNAVGITANQIDCTGVQ